jgi:hypothetical protein
MFIKETDKSRTDFIFSEAIRSRIARLQEELGTTLANNIVLCLYMTAIS